MFVRYSFEYYEPFVIRAGAALLRELSDDIIFNETFLASLMFFGTYLDSLHVAW